MSQLLISRLSLLPTSLPILATLCGCAITYDQPLAVFNTSVVIKPHESIAVGSPELHYRVMGDRGQGASSRASSDSSSTAHQDWQNELIAWTMRATREELGSLGRPTKDIESLNNPVGSQCVSTASSIAEAISSIRAACNSTGADLILCQHVVVEPGPDAEWKVQAIPLGFIAKPTGTKGSVYFRAAIRRCNDAAELWRSEVFFRGSPETSNPAFQRSMRSLFRSITPTEAKK